MPTAVFPHSSRLRQVAPRRRRSSRPGDDREDASMALAILDQPDESEASLSFCIDTGTNPFSQLKIGRSIRGNGGFDWVDDVYVATPLVARHGPNDLLDTARRLTIPLARLERGRAYAQLFSFRDASHRAPAFSPVVGFAVVGEGARPRDRGRPSMGMQVMTNSSDLTFQTA